MFGITRRHVLDHAPAFPNPCLRFADGARIPVFAEEEPATPPIERAAASDRTEPAPEP